MTIREIMYNHPGIYEVMLKIVNGTARYEYISEEIGEDQRVLDLGCGTCMILDFMDESNQYVGIDCNMRFLEYAQKKRQVALEPRSEPGAGLLILADIFDFSSYPKFDVVIVCDILHHVYPKHAALMKKVLGRKRKAVVCEPIGEQMTDKLLADKLLGFDSDGVNKNDEEHGPIAWNNEMTATNLASFFRRLRADKIQPVHRDLIATFGGENQIMNHASSR